MNQQPIAPTLTQEVTLQRLDARGGSLDLPASLTYDPADPWAVAMTFRSRHEQVRWVVGRDLLLQGVTCPAGEGDVVLWPSIDENGRAAVVMELCSPGGRLQTRLRTHDLYRFLTRTLALVPLGTEWIDLEAMVGALTVSEAE